MLPQCEIMPYEITEDMNKLKLVRRDMPRNIYSAPQYGPNTYMGHGSVIDFISDAYQKSVIRNLEMLSEDIKKYYETKKITLHAFNIYFIMMFNFRHYVELQFKSFCLEVADKIPKPTHKLSDLYENIKEFIVDNNLDSSLKDIIKFIEDNEHGAVEYYRYLMDTKFAELEKEYTIDLDIYAKINSFLKTMNALKSLRYNYTRLFRIIKLDDLDEKWKIIKCLRKEYYNLDLPYLIFLQFDNYNSLFEPIGLITLKKELLKEDDLFLKEFDFYYNKLIDYNKSKDAVSN